MVREHYRKQKQWEGRGVCSYFTESIDKDSDYVSEGPALVRRGKKRDIPVYNLFGTDEITGRKMHY